MKEVIMTNHTAPKPKKMKVGTILDMELYGRLRLLAAKEGRSISTIIQEALLKYERDESRAGEMRTRALDSVFALGFRIPDADLRKIMEEDYYEQ
jgi:hypothetical protein